MVPNRPGQAMINHDAGTGDIDCLEIATSWHFVKDFYSHYRNMRYSPLQYYIIFCKYMIKYNLFTATILTNTTVWHIMIL